MSEATPIADGAAGREASVDGDQTSVPPPPTTDGATYGRYYYQHYSADDVPYGHSEHWVTFFGGVADTVVRQVQPASVLDAGCAMGLLVEALRDRGVEAFGVDASDYAIANVDPSVAEHCWVASLTEPLPRHYDLITCIEVIEHIDPGDAEKVLVNLCNATDQILLSSTPFDLAEVTHVNVRPPEEWSEALAREGFLRDLSYDASYLSPWAALYRRIDEPLSTTVRRYDRSWWRLRWEVNEVRGALLAAQGRLEATEQGASPRRVIDAEVVALKEDNLRLRDQAIGKEAELGTALGRIAELEAWSERWNGLADHFEAVSAQRDALLRSRSWRLSQAALLPLRWLRSGVRGSS